MILSLITMLGGGLLRLLPELLAFLNKKTDNTHELAMLDRQAALEQTRAAAHMDEIHAQFDGAAMLAMLDAQKTALAGQMQITGVRWADALNFLVRPLTTYYMLALYGVAKAALFWTAYESAGLMWPAMAQIYDAEDRALLTGILSFWFVGRVLDKQK